MTIEEMRCAVQQAECDIMRAESMVRDMLRICAGRIRRSNCPGHVLAKIKRELQDYNIQTGRWKD